jgi:hypothetical protein
MVLVGVAPGWVVPGPPQIDDLGVLAAWVHHEAVFKARLGRDVLVLVGYVLIL